MILPLRKIIFWTHLITGLTIGLVIVNMAVTGMIMAFEPQILDWVESDRRVVPVPVHGAPRLSLEEIASRARAAMPGEKLSALSVKADPAASVMANFGREGGSLYVNPYTGETLGGDSKANTFLHWAEDWHRWFGKKEIGKPITGAACLAFFFMALSGLYIWFPKAFSVTAFKSITLFDGWLSGKARDWNWHNVFGFWCLPLILVTTTTGLIMSYDWANQLLYKAARSEMPVFGKPAAQTQSASTPVEEPAVSWDQLLAVAQSAEPVWTSITLRAPQKPGGPFNANVQLAHPWHPRPLTLLTLDPKTAAIVKSTPFAAQNRGVRWRTWVKYLHTGEAGKLPGQLLMFLSAMGAVMLVWTGAALSIRRYSNYRQRKKSPANGDRKSARSSQSGEASSTVLN